MYDYGSKEAQKGSLITLKYNYSASSGINLFHIKYNKIAENFVIMLINVKK